jgi:hypothetical protein
MSALARIKKAGFDVAIDGNGFTVTNANLLTPNQREFLKTHKAEIIAELRAEANSTIDGVSQLLNSWNVNHRVEYQEYTEPLPGPLVVTCYTPAGGQIQVEARDEEHAAWLKQMNPKPLGTAP